MHTRFTSLARVGRATAAVALIGLLLTSAAMAQSPSPLAEAGPITSANKPGRADRGYAAEIVAAGLGEATAAFMARTSSTVETTDAHSWVVRHVFPIGAGAAETYHLPQAEGMQPGDPPEVALEISGDELRYQVRCAISG
jgi:hypothetical protein